jgi:hypothetical protein
MQTKVNASKQGHSGLRQSLRVIAIMACLAPAAAAAQPPNPTASDLQGNTAGGSDALLSVTSPGGNNTAFGIAALVMTTTGQSNTGAGSDALHSNTIGSFNAATGTESLYSNTTGSANTASGYASLRSNTAGSQNTAAGYRALRANTDGGLNTATGYDALFSNTLGGANTAIGVSALYSNTTGPYNTANGVYALKANTTGRSNVALGYGALLALAGNSNANIAVGTKAGSMLKAGTNNIYIGSPGVTNEGNTTRIGDNQTKVFVAGIAGTPVSGASVVVTANGRLGVVASSERYKQNIKSLSDASQKLAQLHPVTYSYKTEPGATHYGLIAEEVDKVMPEIVVRDQENRPESVQYQELIPLLLQERQELRAELARQRSLIEQQAETLAALRRTLDARLAALDQSGRTGVANIK